MGNTVDPNGMTDQECLDEVAGPQHSQGAPDSIGRGEPENSRMNNQLRLLTVKELADLLGIHERSVWRLAAMAAMAEGRHGDFPRPLRIGPKTIRWRLADVEAYLAALAGGGR